MMAPPPPPPPPQSQLVAFNLILTSNSEVIPDSKAGVPLPGLKEFDDIDVDKRNRMRFMFAQISSDFSFPLPDRSDTIFVMFVP